MAGNLRRHDEDFVGWTVDQSNLLKARRFHDLDMDNLSEEIADLGRSERRELLSHAAVLICHLVKWAMQPERRGVSWENTLRRTRSDIEDIVADSPSLRPWMSDKAFLDRAWVKGVAEAGREMQVSWRDLPGTSPWSIEEMLDIELHPEDIEPRGDARACP